jgi:hypothetical protein
LPPRRRAMHRLLGLAVRVEHELQGSWIRRDICMSGARFTGRCDVDQGLQPWAKGACTQAPGSSGYRTGADVGVDRTAPAGAWRRRAEGAHTGAPLRPLRQQRLGSLGATAGVTQTAGLRVAAGTRRAQRLGRVRGASEYAGVVGSAALARKLVRQRVRWRGRKRCACAEAGAPASTLAFLELRASG